MEPYVKALARLLAMECDECLEAFDAQSIGIAVYGMKGPLMYF